MAIGTDVIKTSGRLIFDLVRGSENTTRVIDINNPLDVQSDSIQAAVDLINTRFTSRNHAMNRCIQPTTWRDANIKEEQWLTTGVHYEAITTVITPVEPDTPEPEPTLAGGRSDEAQAEERSQEERNEPQGEWQG